MIEVLHPDRVRYKLLRVLMTEDIIDEPNCLAVVVDHIATEYEKDWSRCVNTCYDLGQDTEKFVRNNRIVAK